MQQWSDSIVCSRCREEIGPAELRYGLRVYHRPLCERCIGEIRAPEGCGVTHLFECAICLPGCTLTTDEDEIDCPSACVPVAGVGQCAEVDGGRAVTLVISGPGQTADGTLGVLAAVVLVEWWRRRPA